MDFNEPEEYAEYYADQLILQYISKDKARETIKSLARGLFINFHNIGKWRSLDDASGEALIAIAELFGISGAYTGIEFNGRKYFATPPYYRGDDISTGSWWNEVAQEYQEGFQRYDEQKDGFFLRYADRQTGRSVLANLSRMDLRGVIRMRAAYLTGDMDCHTIQTILDNYYPGSYISERHAPPTLVYHIHPQYRTTFEMLIETNQIFKPDGVNVEYVVNEVRIGDNNGQP